jgi:hypothetical protein
MRKVLNLISAIIVIFGFLLLIGTAGGVELDTITLGQGFMQGLLGLGLMLLGGFLFNATNDPNDYKED